MSNQNESKLKRNKNNLWEKENEKNEEKKWKSSHAGCVSLKDERDDGKNTCENMHYINTITYLKRNHINNINIIYIYKYT